MSSSRLRPLLVFVFLSALSSSLFAANPWDGKPFASDPKDLLAAAAAVEPKAKDDGVVVLLDEANFTLDAQGRVTRAERLVFRVVDEASVESWSSIEATWSPWYQEKPKVEARVVTKAGAVHMLDPKSFGTSDADDEPDMFTDTRELRGPLPAVAAGCVVEQLITYREKNSLYDAGSAHRVNFGRWVETQQTRVSIEYPSSLMLHLVNRTTPEVKPAKSESNGTVRLLFESGRLPAIESTETNLPSDISNFSYLAFSTGKSWQDVARRYSEIVDKQIGSELPAKQTAAAVGDAKEPREIAARLLASVEREIRYAGVEFGEGSIIPRTPSETLAHKYGDCKDKATLLVAMLRQAGVPAHAVLLEAGPGLDVNPDLPGLGHFNHVIVATDGPNGIWIDPTDEFARAGELPLQDQDRLALIASPETTSLARTPADAAAINRTVETREFTLAEDGKGIVVETTDYDGSDERGTRRRYAGSEAKAQREGLEKYANETYLSKSVSKFQIGDPHDLTKPFRIVLQVADAGRGVTGGGEAAVGIFMSRLVGDMPWDLGNAGDDDAELKPGEKKRKPRVHDYVFQKPYMLEIHYRVHPPLGYTLREIPQNETLHLGTATITKEWLVQPDGVVLANLRFDSGPRRISAAQYEETRKEVSALEKEKAFLLYFDQVGRKYLDAGEVGKAVGEFRRISELHPKEALHHVDIANALLVGGMGTAARREAKRAVEIEPKSAKAHQSLALALVHDLLGRLYRYGADLPAAIGEYHKAKELDPKNALIREQLAEALSYGADGEQYGKGAHYAEAIDEYLAMKKDNLGDALAIDRELMVLYSRSEKFAELKKLTETTKETEKKDIFRLVAIAALEGAPAAVKASESIELAKRRNAQHVAASTLALLRIYPPAAELLAAATQGAPNAAELRTQLDLLRKLKRSDHVPFDPADPKSVVRKFFMAASADQELDSVKPLFQSEVLAFDDDSMGTGASKTIVGKGLKMRKKIRNQGTSSFFTDIAVAAVDMQQDGSDDVGVRIRLLMPAGAPQLTLFLVREKDQYRIAALNFSPAMLALRALRLSEAGKNDAARQWLDWARDFVHGGDGEDPLAAEPFATVWTRGKEATPEEIRLAAAMLLPDGKKAAEVALPILLAGREKASDDRKWRIDRALVSAYSATKKWDDVLAVTERLAQKYPDSEWAFTTANLALTSLGRDEEVQKRALARLAKLPKDRVALRALGHESISSGDYAKALDYYAKVLAEPDAREDDYNEHAWAALFTTSDIGKAIEEARQAVSLAPESYASLNTLAALYAEEGKSSEARDTLLKSLDALGEDDPQPSDWYVVGRIAEDYGINDAAVEAYQHVTKPERLHGSSYELAQKRLMALKK